MRCCRSRSIRSQEFRVTVGGEGADQGRSSGGQVVLVTKSGTNQLHGSLYEYNRNTATSANTWFNNQSGVPVQQLVRNQFGASIGGPIKKDRMFYFFAIGSSASTPAAWRRCGRCLRRSLKQGFCRSQLTDGSVQTISPSELPQIDPLGIGLNTPYQKILNQYPGRQRSRIRPGRRIELQRLPVQRAGSFEQHGLGAKLDYRLDDAGKHTLSLRGTLQRQHAGSDPGAVSRPGAGIHSARQQQRDCRRATRPCSAHPDQFIYLWPDATGPGVLGRDRNRISVRTDCASLLCRISSARPKGQDKSPEQVLDDVTWTKGKHTITMGVNFRFNRNNTRAYTNSFPLYAYGATELIGLGEDIDNRPSLSGGQARQSESATGESDGGHQRFGHAAGHS